MLLLAINLDGTLLPEKPHEILGQFPKREVDHGLPDSIIERHEFSKLIQTTKGQVAYGVVTNGVNKARPVVVLETLGIKEEPLIQAFFPEEAMRVNKDASGSQFIKRFKQFEKDWKHKPMLTVFSEDLPTDYYEKLCKVWPSINLEREGAGKNLHIANMIKMHNKKFPHQPITQVCLCDDLEESVAAVATFKELVEKLDDDELRNIKIEAIKVEKNKGYIAQVTQKVNLYCEQFMQASAMKVPVSKKSPTKTVFFSLDLISQYQREQTPNNLRKLFDVLCDEGKGKAMSGLGDMCLMRAAFREAYYFYALAYAVEEDAKNKEYFWNKMQKAQNCSKLLVKFDNFSAKHFDSEQKNVLTNLMQRYINEDDQNKGLSCWQEILVARNNLLAKLPKKADGQGNIFEVNDLTTSKNVFYAIAAQLNIDDCPAELAKCRQAFAEALISWAQPLNKSDVSLESQLDRADYYADKLTIGLQLIQKLPNEQVTNRLQEMLLGKKELEKTGILWFVKSRYPDPVLKEVIKIAPDWLKSYLGVVASATSDLPKQSK